MSCASLKDLQDRSREIRREVLAMAHRAKSSHLASALSTVDLLAVLYFDYLHLDPASPQDPGRDRFILSKGHGGAALYAALAHRGFFPREELETYCRDGGRLPGHPSATMLPGVELSTGSLGHGLGVGSGMALAAKRDEKSYRTVVMVSDGECDEGSLWEAALAAPHWKLGSLTCIVDYNKIQSFGRVSEVMELEPFAEKWRAFRWHVQELDGHDHAAIRSALRAADAVVDQPSVLIAHTVKGKGISFMEDALGWHYWSPSDEQKAAGLAELSSSPHA